MVHFPCLFWSRQLAIVIWFNCGFLHPLHMKVSMRKFLDACFWDSLSVSWGAVFTTSLKNGTEIWKATFQVSSTASANLLSHRYYSCPSPFLEMKLWITVGSKIGGIKIFFISLNSEIFIQNLSCTWSFECCFSGSFLPLLKHFCGFECYAHGSFYLLGCWVCLP